MFDIVVERDDDIRVLFPVLRRIREGESLLAEFRLVGNEDVCQLGGSIDIRRILRVDGYAVGHLRRRTVYRVYVFYLGIVVPRGEFFHRQSEYIEYFGVEGSPVVVFGIARVRVDVRILDGLSVVDVPGLLEVLLVFRSDVVFGYFEFDVGVGDCLVIHERVYFEYGGTAAVPCASHSLSTVTMPVFSSSVTNFCWSVLPSSGDMYEAGLRNS